MVTRYYIQGKTMNNDIVQEGLGIISDILMDGVAEWASAATQDGDDWEIIDRLRAEDDFATACLYVVHDVTSRVAIVETLVKSAAGTIESLLSGWDDEQRSDVPSFLAGQEACETWLAKYEQKVKA